ncbi:unnamed protein product [Rotaria socialis]|uniref:Uncharacterized protein n=1 Tax=Rotaria socialis TaxID=392032 RepID=A0A818M7G5_9BILA|nr:unnamed protein product [Rotaria socialis]CAF4875491.1 unnamed protein product [Rotaria socialis]
MYRNLIILATIISQTTCDCLYPEWKKTCQKYCMDNQFYEIQLNQCYSMNPIQLRCRCSGKDLTEKIRAMVDNNDSESTSSSTSSTIQSTAQTNEACIPSSSCTIGKSICYGINAYCTCEDGAWVSVTCPKENLCKTKNMITSCQKVSVMDENSSLLSVSNLAVTIEINEYCHGRWP